MSAKHTEKINDEPGSQRLLLRKSVSGTVCIYALEVDHAVKTREHINTIFKIYMVCIK